jgi:tetratricopeptide (TPR) repeat protein
MLPLLFSALFSGTHFQATPTIHQARALLFDRQYGAAQAAFEAILAGDGTNLEASLGRIDALGYQKQLAAATQDSGKQNQEARAALVAAHLLLWQRKSSEAKPLLVPIADDAAIGYLARYLLAQIASQNKDHEQAMVHLKASIAQNPQFSESYYLLGDLHRMRNEQNQLIPLWKTYLGLIARSSRSDYVNTTLLKLAGR